MYFAHPSPLQEIKSTVLHGNDDSDLFGFRMTERRVLETLSTHIAEVTHEVVKQHIVSMEQNLAVIYKLSTEAELYIPFLRLVQRNELLQLRMRFNYEEKKYYVLRQQPVIWLSYDWKHHRGVQSKPDSMERYIEFEWFGLKARAYFMPVPHWKDREFTFRFATTNTSIVFNSSCTMADIIPPLPRSLFYKDGDLRKCTSEVIKKHVAALRYTRYHIKAILELFDKLADKHM